MILHREIPCPYCGTPQNAASGVEGSKGVPKHGDVSICSKCSYVAVFTWWQGQLGIRLPTPIESTEFLSDPGVLAAQDAVYRMSRPGNKGEPA